jgi:hypothetical protein
MSVPANLEVEPDGESSGYCDCCGRTSRTVWGWVHSPEGTLASYFVQWTEEHLAENGANIDFIVGRWGEGSSAQDRVAVSLVHRGNKRDGPSVMVVDAHGRPISTSPLVGSALAREEVMGTPLAKQIFAMIDAIYVEDSRFF